MTKVFALREQSLNPAVSSLKNSAAKLIEFMYGSEERVKLTYAFAFGLLILGVSMMPDTSHMAVCAL